MAGGFRQQRVKPLAQGVAVKFVVNALRNADVVILRQMHQKPPCQRNLRGKSRPFAVNRVFNHLHQQRLPFKQNVFNALIGFRVLPLLHNIHNVQKRRPLQAHVHKRALHPRQHAAHNAQINIAHQAVLAVALNVQLANIVLFQNRHARFLRRNVHQHRFGRARQILGQRVGFKSHDSFQYAKK